MKRRATKLAIAMALALSATATMAACDGASMKEGFGGFVDTVIGFAGEDVSNSIKDGFNGIVDKIFPSEEPEVPAEPVKKEVTVTLNDGANTTTKKVTVGEAYDLGTPSKTGYTFGGWYNGETLVAPTGTWAGEADVTLTAKWTAVEYAITYQGFEGENTNPAKYTVEDEDITLVAPATKVGYTFAGWKNAEGEVVTTVDTSVAKAITFTATWTANEYKIFLYENFEATESYADVTVTYDAPYSVGKDQAPEAPKGLTFADWFIDEDTRYVPSLAWNLTENLNLYAKWGTKVTFNYGEAENEINDVVSRGAVEGESWNWTDIETPVKTGYAFAGWYYGTGDDAVKVELSGDAWAYDAVITLTAKFEAHIYSVMLGRAFAMVQFGAEGNHVVLDENGDPVLNDWNGEPVIDGWAAGVAGIEDSNPGYKFLGYQLDTDGDYVGDGDYVDIYSPWTLAAEENGAQFFLEPKWEVISYNIDYVDAYGGVLVDGAEYVETFTVVSDPIDLSALKLTKYGYNFLGWKIQGTDTILETFSANDLVNPETWALELGDVVLEAVWEVSQDEGWTKNY